MDQRPQGHDEPPRPRRRAIGHATSPAAPTPVTGKIPRNHGPAPAAPHPQAPPGTPGTPRERPTARPAGPQLEVLAGDQRSWIAEQAQARLATTTRDRLVELASSPNLWARRWAAENPKLPAETLAVLAGDPDEGVRAAAAANPSCPPAARAHAGLLAG